MRIGLIAPPWAPIPPPLYGGIELVVDKLATGFQAAGHDVLLLAAGDSTCPVPMSATLPAAEGTRIGLAVPELRHVIHAYDAVRDCDIVHDHTILGPHYARQLPDVPVVTTIHNALDDDMVDVYRRVADRASLVAISHAQRKGVPDLPVARVIHHGIDVGDFPFGEGDGGYCLFLGRMSADKGAHRAIAVAGKAGMPLIMAAKMRDAAERAYFESEVEPHLGAEVQYLGEVPHEHKLELLAGAAGLLFPIRWPEPFGLVMLEAMACGTPVLAFPEGAVPEVVDDGRTGFLCRDEGEMAEALSRVDVIDRAACRASVEGYFSTTRMVREHLDLFHDIVAR